jgi:hypothetical protein
MLTKELEPKISEPIDYSCAQQIVSLLNYIAGVKDALLLAVFMIKCTLNSPSNPIHIEVVL